MTRIPAIKGESTYGQAIEFELYRERYGEADYISESLNKLH